MSKKFNAQTADNYLAFLMEWAACQMVEMQRGIWEIQLIKLYDQNNKPPIDTLKTLLITANDKIACWEKPSHSQETRAGGCAGTVVLVYESKILLFHAGDTIALLLKGNYHSDDDHILLTTLHNSVHGGLTSFWGIGKNLCLEQTQHPFNEDDILILATDGLTEAFTHKEIARMVRNMDYFTPDECEKTCHNLCQKARKRGSFDDISVLLVYREE